MPSSAQASRPTLALREDEFLGMGYGDERYDDGAVAPGGVMMVADWQFLTVEPFCVTSGQPLYA